MHLKSFCLDVGKRKDGNACLCLESMTEQLALLSILTSYLIKYSTKEEEGAGGGELKRLTPAPRTTH